MLSNERFTTSTTDKARFRPRRSTSLTVQLTRAKLNNGRRSQSVSKLPSSLTTDNLPVHEPPAADSEPGPSYWQEANQLLGLSWEFHWAGFGFLFGLSAVHSVFVLAQIQARKGFGRRPFFLGVKILLAILGTTGALFLFVDPYSSGENGVLNTQAAFKTCLRYSLSFFDVFVLFDPSGFPGRHQE